MVSSTLKIIGYLFLACLMVQAQNPGQKTNPCTISGKVTFKGKGLPGITVGARSQQSRRSRNPLLVSTDQLGNCRIANVSPFRPFSSYQSANTARKCLNKQIEVVRTLDLKSDPGQGKSPSRNWLNTEGNWSILQSVGLRPHKLISGGEDEDPFAVPDSV